MKRITSILQRVQAAIQKRTIIHALTKLKAEDRFSTLVQLRKLRVPFYQMGPQTFTIALPWDLPQVCWTKLEAATDARWYACQHKSKLSGVRLLSDHNAFEDILSQALQQRASDVLLTLTSQGAQLQFRCQRQVFTQKQLPLEQGELLLKSFLSAASLNIDNTLRAQEGHFRYVCQQMHVFCRLSYMASPVVQSLVLRLLSESIFPCQLSSLQLPDDLYQTLTQKGKTFKAGMILISGPTGSGKTTTLYSIADFLHKQGKKIIAIEDPIEIELSSLVQTEINPQQNYRIQDAMHAVLRQDPDVIVWGEIRDTETAQAAFYSSLSGYLVITTLHANDLAMVSQRCAELGIDFSVFKDNVKLQIHQQWTQAAVPQFEWIFQN